MQQLKILHSKNLGETSCVWEKTGVFFQKIRPFENYSEKKGWLPSSW